MWLLNIAPVGVRFVQYLILNTCMMLYITLQYDLCCCFYTFCFAAVGDTPSPSCANLIHQSQPPVVHQYSTAFFNLHTPGRLHMCCGVNCTTAKAVHIGKVSRSICRPSAARVETNPPIPDTGARHHGYDNNTTPKLYIKKDSPIPFNIYAVKSS